MRTTFRSIFRALVISLAVALAPACGSDEVCDSCDKAGTLETCTACDSAQDQCTMTIREKNGGKELFSCTSKIGQSCSTQALLNYCDAT